MRTLIQRVQHASVTIDGQLKSKIGKGLLVLVGIEDRDTQEDIEWLCKKIANLRIFDDENGVMNRSVTEIGGSILIVSQFTLLGDVRKGNRPSYFAAAAPETAKALYRSVVSKLKGDFQIPVEEGVFQAEMLVRIYNNGPVTILLDSRRLF